MKNAFSRITRSLIIIAAGTMLTLQVASAGAPRDPAVHFYEDTLGDLSDNLQDAIDQKKKGILFYFEQKDCPFCDRMKTTIMNQPEVQDYYRKHFIILRMDIETTNELTYFDGSSTTPKKFFAKVARNRGATPVFAFFNLKGEMVVRYTGATTSVKEFLWLGEYASQGIYTKMPFSRYKRQKKKESRAQ